MDEIHKKIPSKELESGVTKKSKRASTTFSPASGIIKEYIDTLLERHDHFAFEAKLDYRLQPQSKTNSYRVSAFFFVPRALQVDPQSYSNEQFIADMSTRIRFKTPAMSLKSLTREDNSASPLIRIKQLIKQVEGASRTLENVEKVKYELKMLACIVKSSLRDQVRFYLNALSAKQINPDIIDNIRIYANDVDVFVSTFRGFSQNFLSVQVPEVLREGFRFVDDYISLKITKSLVNLGLVIQKMPGMEIPFNTIKTIVEQEMAHRRQHNSLLFIKEGTENELYSYWEGIFKKYTQTVLYLDQRKSEDRARVSQILYALSAGIAMFLFIVIFANLSSQSYQDWYIWLPVIAAYILKDRIKGVLQNLSDRALNHWFPDREGHIFEHESNVRIGSWKESVNYLPLEKVPSEILSIRQASNKSPIEQEGKPELVIKYVKKVILNPVLIRSRHERHTDINDILRFNVQHFLSYADDPYRTRIIWVSETQEFRKIKYAKVYHVNVVFKLEYLDDTRQNRVQYKKIRVVLDQNGIKRVVELL
ncbi:MAG: hypothetical protein RBG13Loki_2627 [Promethearchaeota archaeon CR_4]|nr:MAG: hypothetical protein RBG13Loki_2627 [Candidatus Lokiarchaeota archaeon CR_4]